MLVFHLDGLVDDPLRPDERFAEVPVYISRIKITAVDVIGRKQGKVVITVLRAGACDDRQGEGDKGTFGFHGVASLRYLSRKGG